MSEVIYTQCDAHGCGRVCPEEPGSYEMLSLGWCRMSTVNGDYDLCPECLSKVLEQLGVNDGKR